MPFQASSVITTCRAALDAEDVGVQNTYSDTLDFIPAINDTINWLLWAIERVKGENSFTEEALREIKPTYVFQLNGYSRFNVADTITPPIVNIIAVYPVITTVPTDPTITIPSDPAKSELRTDVSVIDKLKSAKRYNDEEMGENANNPFVDWAYCEIGNYTSSNYTNTYNREVDVRTKNGTGVGWVSVPYSLVGVTVLVQPTPVASTSDNVMFPVTLQTLFSRITLKFIAFKQGDERTSMYNMTNEDINYLLKDLG